MLLGRIQLFRQIGTVESCLTARIAIIPYYYMPQRKEVLPMDQLAQPQILIKITGDLRGNQEILNLIREQASAGDVVVLIGGGTDITAVLKSQDPEYEPDFRQEGRVLTEQWQKIVAKKVLENNRSYLQKALRDAQITAKVIIPVMQPTPGVICHVNADKYAAHLSNGFDRVFIITLPKRLRAKKKEFATHLRDYPDKIEIVSIDEIGTKAEAEIKQELVCA